MRNESKISAFTYTVKPCFTDTRLIRTPYYYGQFALSFWKGNSLYIDTFYDPLSVRDWFDCTENAKFTTSA